MLKVLHGTINAKSFSQSHLPSCPALFLHTEPRDFLLCSPVPCWQTAASLSIRQTRLHPGLCKPVLMFSNPPRRTPATQKQWKLISLSPWKLKPSQCCKYFFSATQFFDPISESIYFLFAVVIHKLLKACYLYPASIASSVTSDCSLRNHRKP